MKNKPSSFSSAGATSSTSSVSAIKSSSSKCVSGLNNLGNTCFFNAVIQNLAQTPYLQLLLKQNFETTNKRFQIKHNSDYDSEMSDNESKPRTPNSESSNSMRVDDLMLLIKEPPGQLTKQFYDLVKSMSEAKHSTVINPDALFRSVCKKVPSFKGFQQQDSHELLRNLIDAVKHEELKRRQAAILQVLGITNSKAPLDDQMKKKIKRYGRLAGYTVVDKVFGGHLLSSIVCQECNECTQRIEPFLDLSLPIVDDSIFPLHVNAKAVTTKLKLTKGKFKLAIKEEIVSSFKKDNTEEDSSSVTTNKKLSKHQLKKLQKEAKKKQKKDIKRSRNKSIIGSKRRERRKV